MNFPPDMSPSDRADLAEFSESVCPECKGRGFVPVKGEAMAADPCGCDEAEDEEVTP